MLEEKDEIQDMDEKTGLSEEGTGLSLGSDVSEEEIIEPEPIPLELVLEPVVEESSAHDDFNWSAGNRNTRYYAPEEKSNLLSKYSSTLTTLGDHEIIKGRVSSVHGNDVVLDINFKSDGLIPYDEFKDMGDLKVGDLVDVYVETQENAKGQLVLSRKKAKLFKAWEALVDSFTNGTIIKGTVISKTKGGLIVDANGLETFLPGSQIDIKPITDYDQYVGKTMEFKVVKINETIKNAVISHKALIESDLAEQRDAIISGLEKGQVLEGQVKNITDFGAFMDLGGVDGLLYITDISWGRVNHPNEVLSMNQKLNVVVLDFDENKKRISLGLKQLQPHPWDVLGETVKEGDIVKGKIVNIEDYGAFLEINPGIEGLIHVSEVSWSNQPVNAREFFQMGQEFEAKVVTLDKDERKMSLSLKQLTQDPWSKIEELYPLNSRHTGTVKNLTPYGVFVELADGIGGMIHISDLSWTKRFSHPSEFVSISDKIDVAVIDIDKDNRKLSLGHKQVEENPWDTFENVFPVGSYHEATVIRKDDKGGAIVQLPYGLEAYAPQKQIKKDNGSYAEVENVLTFKVIEFNRDDKRILVSHTRYLEDIKKEANKSVKSTENTEESEKKIASKAAKTLNTKAEKTTLGELAGFTALQEQLKNNAGSAVSNESTDSKETEEK
ncbi:MAG: 30S ribosomal protein S1 [Saprospiraceae bacterium]|nr:30S ribosomal protein S1 [Saprospiraceae bacterium]